MACFSLALIHHRTEQATDISLIMIKTITESFVDGGVGGGVECNHPSIRYIHQANHFHFQQMKMNSL